MDTPGGACDRKSDGLDPCDTCTIKRDLYNGDEGEDVACIQRYLKREGMYSGPETAYFGERTESAVEKWQVSAVGVLQEVLEGP